MTIEENSALIACENFPVIIGDEIQLTQLFQNLISNAIKFRKQTEFPRIHIRAEQRDHQWMFSVQDNGIGVELEHIQSIVDIFIRVHAQSEYAGSGIGLALCKKIVEFHRGKIWAQSRLGEGTTIYFTLPRAV